MSSSEFPFSEDSPITKKQRGDTSPILNASCSQEKERSSGRNEKNGVYESLSPTSLSLQSPQSSCVSIPISALSPYSGNKWSIVARVTYKSEKLPFRNGSGQFFTIHLLDSYETEIRCTFYTDACEKFFDMVELNRVYKFCNAKVKDVLDKRYTSIRNSYDLTFDTNSAISDEIDNGDIKMYVLNSTTITNLADADLNRMVDVMGMIKSVLELQTYQTQTKSSQKRDVTLFDQSGEIRLTLWDDFAESVNNYEKSYHLIIGVKNVRVSEYLGGRSLSTTVSSSLIYNPSEGESLRNWVTTNGGDVDSVQIPSSLSGKPITKLGCDPPEKRHTIDFIKNYGLGKKEQGDVVTLKMTVTHVHHDRRPWYDACPTKGCNKKVTEIRNNCWQCEKCRKEFTECTKRFILTCTCSDYTGQLLLTFYNDQAEKLLGATANLLNDYLEKDLVSEYENVISHVLFKSYIVSVRVKEKVVREDVTLESTVLCLEDLNWGIEGVQLFNKVSKL